MLASLLAACGACTHSDEVDRHACEQLRDHVVDLRITAVKGTDPNGGPPIDFEPHRAALKQALGEGYLETCLKTFTVKQLRCALDSSAEAAETACLSTGN